jgi:hypothetical protein
MVDESRYTWIRNRKIAMLQVAKELIPNTEGPARGFLKNNCKINPTKLNPKPAHIEVNTVIILIGMSRFEVYSDSNILS